MIITTLTEAVALGLLYSLYFSEALGFVAGGLVVPGYIAVISSNPGMLIATLLASLLSLGVLKLVTKYALIYGRRKLFLSVVLGFIFAQLTRMLYYVVPNDLILQLQAFGFIIPGLMAYWMDKQGVMPSLGMLAVVVTLVRLTMIVIHGGNPII